MSERRPAEELPDEVELGPRTQPVRVSPATLGLIGAGGALGTGLRYGITLLWPSGWSAPLAIGVINVFGAFVLGLILELLSARGADVGHRRLIRLGVGTGVLGGFTTYSTLALDTVTLSGTHPGLGIAYGLGSVLVGGAASLVGIAVARLVDRPRTPGGAS